MAVQPTKIRGSHHCIGTGRFLADLIFQIVQDRAVAKGGTVSVEDIVSAKTEFILGLPSRIGLFEKINQECMLASGSTAPDPFSSDHLLATLLEACGKGSARVAFRVQVQQCGQNWLDSFFQGLSQVARKNLSDESWKALIVAYVNAAEIAKAGLQVLDLVSRNEISEVLADAIVPLYRAFESDKIVSSLNAGINSAIVSKFHLSAYSGLKITDVQLKQFLMLLEKEMPLRLGRLVGTNSRT